MEPQAYEVNKGIGRTVEFQGLRATYLFIFAGGLIIDFILVVILLLVGVNNYFAIVLGVLLATAVIGSTMWMNKKYGVHGLMKLMARNKHPQGIRNNRSVYHLLSNLKKTKTYE